MAEPRSYSKREIDMCFEQVNSKLDALGGVLSEVHDQVTKTNGRVQVLERWRMFITGGLTVLGLLFVPVLITMVENWMK
jgi:hypothetical protein